MLYNYIPCRFNFIICVKLGFMYVAQKDSMNEINSYKLNLDVSIIYLYSANKINTIAINSQKLHDM